MLDIAKTVFLEVIREAPMGLILGSADAEVLLPSRYVPEGAAVGDVLEVFLYTDSEDRPIATTETPLAQADEFAALRVVSVNQTGAFLDWGLPKDLLLPFRLQRTRVQPDQRVVVRVFCDEASGRPVATTKLQRFLEPPPRDLLRGQPVEILVYEGTDLGSKVIVEGRYPGLVFLEPGSPRLPIGTSRTGYIQQVRPDGKVDLSLVQSGKAGLEDAREVLLDALDAAGGRIALCDQSSPEEIRRLVGLSKKAFKRAVGTLYRERRLEIGEASITLRGEAQMEADTAEAAPQVEDPGD